MIAFVSLFLGLVFGVKPVEVVVGEGVAVVELRLDGEVVGVLRGAPWTQECDFGDELAPRHLEAVALDAAGREVARVSQWLNLPQPRAQASVVVEPPRDGGPWIARASWESAAGAEPKAVTATLDDQPIAVDDPRRIVLPPVDASQLHLLQVELRFEDRVTSRVDVTFGGEYTDQVSTEITALPLVSTRPSRQSPTRAAAAGWFLKDGKPLRVIAIEKETAEIVIVLGRPFPHFVLPGQPYKAPKALDLASDLSLRFLATHPKESVGVASTFELFPISPAYDGGVGDLYQMLTGILRPPQDRPSRPTAAVAVAGLAAYEGRHRRAVVLIPSHSPGGDDALTAAQVRRYLERLRVPLYVWDPETKPAPELAAWGEVASVGSFKKLAEAFTALTAQLEQQWIVWLDGQHLPQDITLAPAADGFALLR